MLRALLEQISNGISPEENIRQVALLNQTYTHTIVSLPSKYPLGEYTCLVHALGFTGQSDYDEVREIPPRDAFAGKDFAGWLLQTRALTEVHIADIACGDLVLYAPRGKVFEHVGIWKGLGRVESKWGSLGLFEHAPQEVPESYGDVVKYFRAISYETAIDLFYNYAEQMFNRKRLPKADLPEGRPSKHVT